MSAIGVDVDDVMYSWFAAAHAASERAGITNGVEPTSWHPYEDYGVAKEVWHAALTESTLDGSMYLQPPIEGSREAVVMLREAGHTVHLVTARGLFANGNLIRTHTIAWLERYDIPVDSLTFSANKALVRCEFFVDDNKQNILDVTAAGARGVLITKPWNADLNWPWRFDTLLEFAESLLLAGTDGPTPYELGGPLIEPAWPPRCEDNHPGKTAYHTKGEASSALQTIRKFGTRWPGNKKPVRVYCHDTCGCWFLTSQPG